MRAVVTGGAGFIGSHLVDALAARGDDVLALDDLSKGRRERVDGDLAETDIRDAAALAAIVAEHRPDVILHLAAQADVRRSVADPAADAAVNVIGTINVLQAAREVGARVVFASTGGAIYGEDAPRPTPESAACEPEAPYGTAKLCAEEYLRLFNRLHGTRHAILRLGNVYGPRQDPSGEAGVVSIFAGRLARNERPTVFGNGRQTRDYVYAGDVVRAFMAAADADRAGLWNVGTGREVSVIDLIDGLAAISGAAIEPEFAPARQGELQASALDPAALERDLGVTAAMPLDDGLRAVYEWVRAGEPVRGTL
jgi:UDP-glucose 4-epimerase